ncbi:MAG TPA: hypothetical protein VII75_15560 [Thermoanaerobaculia bacterium]|jgi:hypothetical protein
MHERIVKVARDAISGRFVTARAARRWPSTTVVETYRVPTRRMRGRRVTRATKATRS